MRPVWRLAISRLWVRPSRTILIVLAVALSAALITVVSSAMASLNAAIRGQLSRTVGAADVVLKPATSVKSVQADWLSRVEAWPGVEVASPSRQESIRLELATEVLAEPAGGDGPWTREPRTLDLSTVVYGVDFATWQQLRPVELVAGRLPEAPGEIVVDGLVTERLTYGYQAEDRGSGRYGITVGTAVAGTPVEEIPQSVGSADEAERLNATVGLRLGDRLRVRRLLRAPAEFTVVGIARQAPLGGRPQGYTTLESLASATGGGGKLTEIEARLAPGVDPAEFAAMHSPEVPEGFVLTTTARVTANVEKNLASSQLGLILATVLAFLTAAFIIFTGLTVDAAQQQRELAMLRCVGASRTQLAAFQLLVGAFIGVAGAVLGVPLGLGIAAAVVSEESVAPRKVPWVQSRASKSSGTVVLRRPPKRIASIGTPRGSSNSGARMSHCLIGVQ